MEGRFQLCIPFSTFGTTYESGNRHSNGKTIPTKSHNTYSFSNSKEQVYHFNMEKTYYQQNPQIKNIAEILTTSTAANHPPPPLLPPSSPHTIAATTAHHCRRPSPPPALPPSPTSIVASHHQTLKCEWSFHSYAFHVGINPTASHHETWECE